MSENSKGTDSVHPKEIQHRLGSMVNLLTQTLNKGEIAPNQEQDEQICQLSKQGTLLATLDNVSILLKTLVFDLECTRRERNVAWGILNETGIPVPKQKSNRKPPLDPPSSPKEASD
jgi:hypothetical protein